MAEYRLSLPILSGYGTITVDGVEPDQYYEEGTSLTIAIALNPGFVSVQWFNQGTLVSSSTSFAFNMPSQDTRLGIVASGNYAPIDGYGLKYYWDYCDLNGDALRLEIYQDGYGGLSSEKQIGDVVLNFGNTTNQSENVIKTIVGSSLDFSILGTYDEFEEFLDGGIRSWKVVYKKLGIIKFSGFLTPDFIDVPDFDGEVLQSFTAIDGLKGFDSIRVQQGQFPAISGLRNKAISALIGVLNQSFVDQRNVNFACDIYEDRMSNLQSVFEQFLTPDAAIFTDGERAKYSDNGVVWNETVFISDLLESLLKPFLCRCFIWDDEFWIVRIPDQFQSSYEVFKFDSDAVLDSNFSVTNDADFSCLIDRPNRVTNRVYTEFTVVLRLGVLSTQAAGAVFNTEFSVDDWFTASVVSPYAGIYILKNWDYVRAIPTSQPSSRPSGDTALVQYVSNSTGEYGQIWTTTTTAGTADPNISYIKLSTLDNNEAFLIADETANTLSFEFEFALISVSSNDPNTFDNHSVGFMVKVGDYYLYQVDSTTFDFTLTETIVEFNATNSGAFNTVKISDVTIPDTGEVEIRLYQLILNTGTRHQYTVAYRNLKLSIEENEAFTLNEIGVKAITEAQYSSVFPEYRVNIGDTETNMSTSAIKLNITDFPVSESWTSLTVTSEPLLGSISQDLADLFGRKAQVLRGVVYNTELVPYQSFQYNSKYWMIVGFQWNIYERRNEFIAFELGDIPST